jgi:hypothetical protein
MTAQIADLFVLDLDTYCVAGISDGPLFEPSLVELVPLAACTACWRGYQAIFGLAGSRLILNELYVNLDLQVAKSAARINGVAAEQSKGDFDLFNCHYAHLGYHLEYSGGLLLASDFIRELYVHMGFHPAWKYRKVIELIFAGGQLQQRVDRSDAMAELRGQLVHYDSTDPAQSLRNDRVREFVERAFDRSYGW